MTKIIGLDNGNTIFKNIFNSEAPSILAASNSSFGRPLKKVRANIIFQTLIAPGKIMDQIVFSIPKSFTTK